MGSGFIAKCEKCGFKLSLYSGIGMLYTQYYEEMILKLAAGGFGRGVKRFFLEHEHVGVNFEEKIYHCEECNRYVTKPCLDMYVLDNTTNGNKTSWSSASPNEIAECLMPGELEELPIGRKYIHRCYKCKKPMQEVNERELLEQLDNGKIKCPKCGGKMSEPSLILWD